MTSILNNVAANTALMNLENTVSNLQSVQNEISTGLKVSSAADNASYFSIASVLRSDSSSLSTVSDTLNLGNSSLSVASTALSQIQTTLSDIKNQLVSASGASANRAVLQEQIAQDQAQLQNISASANFNGQNFLSVNSSLPGYNSTASFVSSYSRDAAGTVSIGYINVNTTNSALFDSGAASAANSIGTTLNGDTTSAALPTGQSNANASPTVGAGTNSSVQTITLYTADPNVAGNSYANTVSVNSSTAVTASVTYGASTTLAAGDTLGGVATGATGEPAGVAAPVYNSTAHTLTFSVIDPSSTTSGQVEYDTVTLGNFTPQTSGNGIFDKVDLSSQGSYTAGGVTTTTTGGTGVSIFNMDIAGLTNSASDMATLNAFQKQVDAAISAVAAAASTLGTAQSRIQAQTSFVSSLQTSINNGVGSLVDADLNQASTRLSALQVQQQLGIQSLSIANQSTQAILKLFQ